MVVLKSPTRIFSAIKCQLSGHAHCKKVAHKTKNGLVVDHILHIVRGCRVIENVPRERKKA